MVVFLRHCLYICSIALPTINKNQNINMKRFLLLVSVLFIGQNLLLSQCTGTEPLISQVAEGSSNNKTVELYNPSGATIDLSMYTLVRVANGNGVASGTNITLSGMLAPGETFVISNGSADAAILAVTDQTSGTISHNGNDSYILYKGATIIDSYGDADNNASFGANQNMERNLSGPCPYDTNPTDDFDPTAYTSSPYSTGFPPGLGSTIGVVPVEFSSFTAKGMTDYNLLSWSTASEVNNDFFMVQHSLDGQNFEDLKYIQGNGTSSTEQYYRYEHSTPAQSINYYRLKQVDYDGTTDYSDVVSVRINNESDFEIDVYPTVFNDIVNISSTSEVLGGEVIIYTLSGQQVYNTTLIEEQVNLSSLNAGTYIIQFKVGNIVSNHRLIKM